MAAAGPASVSGNAVSAPRPAEQAPDVRADEQDATERAPRTPSPWDADGDVHPVLERFKRVRPAESAAVGRVLCCWRPGPEDDIHRAACCTWRFCVRGAWVVTHLEPIGSPSDRHCLRRVCADSGGDAGEGGRPRGDTSAPPGRAAQGRAAGTGAAPCMYGSLSLSPQPDLRLQLLRVFSAPRRMLIKTAVTVRCCAQFTC